MHRLLAVAASLALSVPAAAAEITVLCAYGFSGAMQEIAPRFERATGHRLSLGYAALGDAVKRVEAGDVADLLVLPSQGLGQLARAGKLGPEPATPVAVSRMGLAVPKGAAKPDISTPEQVKRLLLAAPAVTTPDPAGGGASATHFQRLFETMGIAAQVKPKLVYSVEGSRGLAKVVADRKAIVALNQLQALKAVPALEIVGPLPAPLQQETVFAATLLPAARDAEAARAFVRYLRSPEAAELIRAQGLDPA